METEVQLKRHQQFIRSQKKQIEKLKERLDRLEELWSYSISDPWVRWLYENQSGRMDANVPIAEKSRREFHLDRYRFAAARFSGLEIGDIACGTGYGSALIFNHQAKSVVGIDISNEAIEYAKAKYGAEQVQFQCASALDTPLPDSSLDGIASFETIEHVERDDLLLKEFSRILKPGGLLICSTPNQWPLEIAPHHVRVYDHDSFVKSLSQDFEVIEMWNQNSGSDFQYNRDQEQGIVETTPDNQELAECYIAVARARKTS